MQACSQANRTRVRDADGRVFPWGDAWEPGWTNHGKALPKVHEPSSRHDFAQGTDDSDGHEWIAPVGSFPRDVSPWGVHDLAGNEMEWTDDWASNQRKTKVLKGCSWKQPFVNCRAASRGATGPDKQDDDIGFRCVGFDGPSHWR